MVLARDFDQVIDRQTEFARLQPFLQLCFRVAELRRIFKVYRESEDTEFEVFREEADAKAWLLG